jgi:Methyltransferase domain
MTQARNPAVPEMALNLSPRALHVQATRLVRNWPWLDLNVMVNSALRRSWRPHELRFFHAPGELKLEGTHELLLAYAGLRVGTVLFGEDRAPEVAREIVEIGEATCSKLRSRFTPAEFRSAATGGRPGLKDALLYGLVRKFRPGLVVETGVAQGVSSTFILAALEQNGGGELISIDLPQLDPNGRRLTTDSNRVDRTYVRAEDGPGWLVPQSLRRRWTLQLGPSEELLPGITQPVDIFFHDSLHTYGHMLTEFNWALRHLVIGGMLVSDDIYWNRAFDDFVGANRRQLRVLSGFRVGVAQLVS